MENMALPSFCRVLAAMSLTNVLNFITLTPLNLGRNQF